MNPILRRFHSASPWYRLVAFLLFLPSSGAEACDGFRLLDVPGMIKNQWETKKYIYGLSRADADREVKDDYIMPMFSEITRSKKRASEAKDIRESFHYSMGSKCELEIILFNAALYDPPIQWADGSRTRRYTASHYRSPDDWRRQDDFIRSATRLIAWLRYERDVVQKAERVYDLNAVCYQKVRDSGLYGCLQDFITLIQQREKKKSPQSSGVGIHASTPPAGVPRPSIDNTHVVKRLPPAPPSGGVEPKVDPVFAESAN